MNNDDWIKRAACKGFDTSVFFNKDQASFAAARAICRSCPVVDTCAEYALADPHLVGFWGGMTPRERSMVRRSRVAQRDTDRAANEAQKSGHDLPT